MIPEFIKRIEALKKKGKQNADANRAHIQRMVSEARYGFGIPQRNMIRALEMLPWLNTEEDWTRYYEAKIIRGMVMKRRRRNPGHARRISQKKHERILFRGRVALMKGSPAEVTAYMSRHGLMHDPMVWNLEV